MNTLAQQLDRLEARIQALVEGRLAGLLPLQKTPAELAHQLVEATRINSIRLSDEQTLAPSHFILQAHPEQVARLASSDGLLAELAAVIAGAGQQAGLTFEQAPEVSLVAEEEIPNGEIVVIARMLQPQAATTQTMAADGPQPGYPVNAFLIVDGLHVFQLDQPVINIGRRAGNDLVIDDPRVSREHAQLRATHGRYLIFDLGSTGGTFVNKTQITRATLQAGDVISLAGYALVFGQDNSTGPAGSTQEIQLGEE